VREREREYAMSVLRFLEGRTKGTFAFIALGNHGKPI